MLKVVCDGSFGQISSGLTNEDMDKSAIFSRFHQRVMDMPGPADLRRVEDTDRSQGERGS